MNCLISKENIANIYLAKGILSKIHIETSNRLQREKVSNLVYCTFYQDGMKHAFDYLIYHSHSGLSFFPKNIFNAVDAYKLMRKEKVKAKKYGDVAYIDGYIEGLKTIIYKDKHLTDIPYFYLYGAGPISEKKDFDKAIRKKEYYHTGAEVRGRKIFASVLKPGSDIVYHHTAFL